MDMIRAVIFDMDGTLWDNPISWDEFRRELGLPLDGRPILQEIAELPLEERAQGEAKLREREKAGVQLGSLLPGASALLSFLRGKGVLCLLVTNNSRESAEGVLRRTGLSFDRVFTRDEGPMKPEAAAFLLPLRECGVRPEEAVVVGDSHLEVLAARAAGIPHVILVRPKAWLRRFIPEDVAYTEVLDLFAAGDLLASWLSAPPTARGHGA